ncbi:hypothetical protein OIU76_008926 [Salix suchowensis]|nr:hypothetical protein OIU76_008926 [Salix suchowensis]
MSKLHIPFLITPLLCFLVLLPLPFKVISQDANTEKTILLNLKQQLGNPPVHSVLEFIILAVYLDRDSEPDRVADIVSAFRISSNGTFPKEISKLSNLEELGLAFNNFVPSSIPVEFGQLKKLRLLWDETREFDCCYLFYNNLSGEIPQRVETLNLVEMDLGMNQLNGSIPEDFGKLKKLQLLSLFENHLSGEVPPSIGLLPELKTFKVFSNNLSGALPPKMGLYSKLEEFDVSTNQFSGQLPEHLCAGGVLQGVVAFEKQSLWAGASISWKLQQFALNSTFQQQLFRLELNNNKFSGPIPPGISSWVNLVVFEAINNLLSGEIPVEITSLPHLSNLLLDGNQFSDLSQNHFSGEIPLEFDQLKPIVLNLSSNHLSGKIPDQFDNLAYDHSFLNNSNLCAVNLNFPNCYAKLRGSKKHALQNSCLDSGSYCDNYFGLARILATQGEAHTMSAVAGSFGYMAPEYAYTTRVNEKIDVYSFGVVLLELATGKEPNSGDEQTSLADWAWQQFGQGTPIADCLDPEIKEPYFLQEMTTVFNLGLICTHPSPSTRPSMKDVLEILRRCSPDSNGETKTGAELDVLPLLGTVASLSATTQHETA